MQQTAATPVVTSIPEKSIAVLPFESLSGNKSDPYFADGVAGRDPFQRPRISDSKSLAAPQ